MLTWVQYLEELAGVERTITVPANEVDRLVDRFGDRVRHLGHWNVCGDGSLEIPVSVIRKAATQLGSHALLQAVEELKAEPFTEMLNSSAAVSLIEKITEAYRLYFRDLMTRYQNTGNPSEATQLRVRLVKEIFGS